MPQSLKRFLSNFNVVAIQNSLDGFRNTLNVGITAEPVAGSLSSGVVLAVTGFGSYGEKFLCSHSPQGYEKHISSLEPSNRVKMVDNQPS